MSILCELVSHAQDVWRKNHCIRKWHIQQYHNPLFIVSSVFFNSLSILSREGIIWSECFCHFNGFSIQFSVFSHTLIVEMYVCACISWMWEDEERKEYQFESERGKPHPPRVCVHLCVCVRACVCVCVRTYEWVSQRNGGTLCAEKYFSSEPCAVILFHFAEYLSHQ